ncbi:MAG TPA: terminase small subunit [Thermomicrobiales bacterium]|nr:terminase small subunit [Thermomicrobiales bacterium]
MTDASAQLAKLTPKQRRFADAYLGEAKGNATEAARIAGYKLPEQSGYENKKKPEIRAYIDDRLNAETLSSAEVLAELTDVGAARWREFVEILQYDDKGEPLRVKMDLSAKIKALELLGKHHQLFSDNLNLNGSIEVREFVGIPDEAP